ncbi:hypothetical protein BH20BAC1_BH20BAC1_09710 [soil metagenome]
MDRRSSIKVLFLVTAGSTLIPGCLQDDNASATSYKNLKLKKDDEALLNSFSDTLVPKTTTPGAADVQASTFALMMVDDCFSPEEQLEFQNGFKEFKEYVNKNLDGPFEKSSQQDRQSLLIALEQNKEASEDLISFYRTMKRYTLQAYTTSQYFLTEVQEYKLVPGRYYGCVPVTKTT